MGAPAWGIRVAAGVTAAVVIGVGAALALPVVTGGGSPSVSVDEVPDTSHAALVQDYEVKVAERKADIEASKEHQARLQKDGQEAKAAEENADAAAKEQAEQEAKEKAEADAKAKEDASTKDATESKESTATKDTATKDTATRDTDTTNTDAKAKDTTNKPDSPDWWPEHVWAHASSCTVAEDGQSVVGTWDVWVKYGGDWVFVSASDDPAEVSGTDGDKMKIVYTDRTATLYKEHDGMAKYRGGPVHVTLASAADSSETHTFTVDLWVVAKADGTCPA